MSNDRLKTFVEKLDDALNGGIPFPSTVLISGPPGAMKSSISSYILYQNALKMNKQGIYITFEQPELQLKRLAAKLE